MDAPPAFADAETRLWKNESVLPDQRFITLASGPTVRVQAVGEGPPVLFVHGAMNGGTSWASLMSRLPGFRCIALDRPGCGLSEPIEGGAVRAKTDTVKAYADDLIPDVLDALELERAAVVATSFGGLFAFRAAAAHPDRIARIVELSWAMGAPMEKVTLSLRMSAMPGMRRLMPKLPMTRGAVRMLLRQIGLRRALANGRFSDDMVEWFFVMLRDTDTMVNELNSTPDVFTPVAGLNRDMLLTDDELARITMPVHFVWGGEDPNGGAGVAREFAARFPAATLDLLEEAGHAPWIDEPDVCATLISGFLSEGSR
jgi:pimeloyl-ACP methyl ester carboxylesterase